METSFAENMFNEVSRAREGVGRMLSIRTIRAIRTLVILAIC